VEIRVLGGAIAVLFAREGADIAIAYLTEHHNAEQTKTTVREGGVHLHPDVR